MARHHQENFPVASRLLPRSCRQEIVALYRFARGADDLADDPAVAPPARAAALRHVDDALRGAGDPADAPDWAQPFLALCRDGCGNAEDGRALLAAFIHDQTVLRHADWEAMLEYCRGSALPVGRSFLALCGERQADASALFAVCACLQILNHLQDIRQDYTVLGRIYLPARWLAEEGVPEEALGHPYASPGLRRVIDRTLAALRPLMEEAHTLPRSIASRRLRMELRWVLAILRQLHDALGRHDPLARRVAPGKAGKLRALLAALLPERKARSSFYAPMRMAASGERAALFALHRFLRALDRAADMPSAAQAALDGWRAECAALRAGRPTTVEGRALLPFMERYQLPVAWLEAVVDGCAMDLDGQMRQPDPARVALYCERVAVAPGQLVLAILGERGAQADQLAHALGQAIQRTNILRDEWEDAALGRRYFHAADREAFIHATALLYAEADTLLLALPSRRLLPVRLMRDVYGRLFDRLRASRAAPTRQPADMPWLYMRALGHMLRP